MLDEFVEPRACITHAPGRACYIFEEEGITKANRGIIKEITLAFFHALNNYIDLV